MVCELDPSTRTEWFFAIFFFISTLYNFSKLYFYVFDRFQNCTDPFFDIRQPLQNPSGWLILHVSIITWFEALAGLTLIRHGDVEAMMWNQFCLWAANSVLVLPSIKKYHVYSKLTAIMINVWGIVVPGVFAALSLSDNYDLSFYYVFLATFHVPVLITIVEIIRNGLRRINHLPHPDYFGWKPAQIPKDPLPPLGKKFRTWAIMDLHTSIFVKLLIKILRSYVPETAKNISVPVRMIRLPLEEIPGFPGQYVSSYDENGKTRSLVQKKLIVFNNKLFPFVDDYGAWPSREEGIEQINRHIRGWAGAINVEWKEATTDLAFERFCFQGLIAHRLARIDSWKSKHITSKIEAPLASLREDEEGGDREAKIGDEEDGVPSPSEVKETKFESEDEGGYVIKLEFMSKYAVREGLGRYGGDAYFDSKGKVRRIRYLGVDIYPGDDHWEYAKWCFKGSALILVTIWDHIIECHYMTANMGVLASRQALGPDHPIRRFLTPFVYRTIVINESSIYTLMPHRALFHRASAMTWPATLQFYHDGVLNYRVQTLAEKMEEHGVLDAPDELYPFKHDGLEYFHLIKSYVHRYLLIYYPTWEIDDEVQHWWQELVSVGPRGKLTDRLTSLDQVERYLSYFVFTVTSFHEHVGSLPEYVLDPAMAASKWAPGATLCSSQTSYQMGVVAMLTGLRMPALLEDWTHVLLEDGRELGKQWLEELRKFSLEVDRRNSTRGQPIVAFNPKVLQTSVSI